jgi:hypothetical protein
MTMKTKEMVATIKTRNGNMVLTVPQDGREIEFPESMIERVIWIIQNNRIDRVIDEIQSLLTKRYKTLN